MSLSELIAQLVSLDIRLSICGDALEYDAPDDGVVTDAIMAALREHKPALVALLARAESDHESDIDCHLAYLLQAEPLPEYPWREGKAQWPLCWQEAWGRLANAIEDETRDSDCPASWKEAEIGAYNFLLDHYRPEDSPQPALDEITERFGWARVVLADGPGSVAGSTRSGNPEDPEAAAGSATRRRRESRPGEDRASIPEQTGTLLG
jgi:hypothetical protein